MENEVKFDEETRKLIRAFRAKVANGQHASRETMLAYSFLRQRPYVAVEKKIAEDHESFGLGRITFLDGLVCDISREIFHVTGAEMEDEVHQWVSQKYETAAVTIAEEKAA